MTERGRTPEAEPKDLLARLISARDSETGGSMTAKEVRDQVVTIFIAGHETTAKRYRGPSICCRNIRMQKESCMTSLRPCLLVARRVMRISRGCAILAW